MLDMRGGKVSIRNSRSLFFRVIRMEMAKYMADGKEDDDTFSLADMLKAKDEEI